MIKVNKMNKKRRKEKKKYDTNKKKKRKKGSNGEKEGEKYWKSVPIKYVVRQENEH